MWAKMTLAGTALILGAGIGLATAPGDAITPVSDVLTEDKDDAFRRFDGDDGLTGLDDDEGDGDNTRGNDGTSGGNNTGDGDNTRGNDGTSGGNNTGGGGGGGGGGGAAVSNTGGGGGGGGGSVSGGGST